MLWATLLGGQPGQQLKCVHHAEPIAGLSRECQRVMHKRLGLEQVPGRSSEPGPELGRPAKDPGQPAAAGNSLGLV